MNPSFIISYEDFLHFFTHISACWQPMMSLLPDCWCCLRKFEFLCQGLITPKLNSAIRSNSFWQKYHLRGPREQKYINEKWFIGIFTNDKQKIGFSPASTKRAFPCPPAGNEHCKMYAIFYHVAILHISIFISANSFSIAILKCLFSFCFSPDPRCLNGRSAACRRTETRETPFKHMARRLVYLYHLAGPEPFSWASVFLCPIHYQTK